MASCAVLLASAGIAEAAPTWSAPIDVSPGDTQAAVPAAAYGESGRLTIAWASSERGAGPTLPTARRLPGGAFADGPSLATADGAADPALARGPAGELYATWVIADPGEAEGDVVMAARLGPDGGAVSPQRLSAQDEPTSKPAIAVGPDGRVAVAWKTTDDRGRGQVRVVHGALGGAALTPRLVSGTDNASAPEVAFDPSGVLHVAWARLDSAGAGAIRAAAELANGTFAAARPISPVGVNASQPALTAVPGTGLAFAWTETDASEQNTTVRVGIEPPGAPVAGTTVSGGSDATNARLATDPAGVLYVAWIRSLSGSQSVLVSARNGAGGLDAPQVVSGGDPATEPDLAFAPEGDAAVTWRRNLGSEETPGDIRAALFDAPRGPPGTTPPLPLPPPVAALPALGLSNFGVSPRCIRYGAPFGGPRRRLTFTFALSETATVVLAIQRRLNSRANRRRCPVRRAGGEPGRFGPPIMVQLPGGAGAGAIPVGEEGQGYEPRTRTGLRPRVLLERKLPAGRRRVVLRQASTGLQPGTYIATLIAHTPDGRITHRKPVKFWVLSSAPRGKTK